MSQEDAPALVVETRVDAPPDAVFAYFVDPARYRRWKGEDAELDARPGGAYRVRMPRGGTVRGEYTVVEPPRRLVFTWGWEGDEAVPPGSTTVEVTLEPDGDATVVRLRHWGFPTDGARDVHREGWVHYLARLAVAGTGGDPGPDPLAA